MPNVPYDEFLKGLILPLQEEQQTTKAFFVKDIVLQDQSLNNVCICQTGNLTRLIYRQKTKGNAPRYFVVDISPPQKIEKSEVSKDFYKESLSWAYEHTPYTAEAFHAATAGQESPEEVEKLIKEHFKISD